MIKSLISTCSSKHHLHRFVTLLLLMICMVIFAGNAYSAQVVLTWTQLGDPVTGYKIYYGPTSGNYTQSIDVGNVTTYTIDNLASGSTYYIAATDHDAANNESGFSNEVIAMIPTVQQYTLAVSKAGTGAGTVTGAGINCGAVCSGSYAAGTDVILTATAATGSVFSGWSGGGGTGTYETVVNAATAVTATFTKVYYITATSDINGAIIPSGNPPVNQATDGSYIIKIVTVSQGANQSFTITPNAGYHLADLKADGTSLGTVSSYTFSNVAADHTLNATFAINSYAITASAGTGGSISPSGATTLNAGANQTFTITPSAGYQIAGVTVDGVSVGAVSTYTFSNVTAGHTIAATFAVKTYTISASSGTGGSISPSGATTVNSGANQTFTITPSAGYHIAGVTVDGVSVGAVSTYTFSNVTAGHTIAATFAVNTYTITASSGTSGSITPTGTSSLNYGSSQSYSIVPATGYSIADVKVDGVSVGAVSTYSFSNVTASHTIAASFTATLTSYTLSAVSSRGGSISPRGSTIVKSGGSQKYTFSPNSGYHIADVKVDGVSVGAVSTYTFTNVTASHTIAANFTNKTYTITASSGTGGSISPAGAKTVYAGANQTFTITPATGYHIAGVTVDGASVGAVSSYTFSNVTAGHTISATFAINIYSITASSGANGSISPTGSTNVNYGGSLTYAITPATGYHIAGVTVDGASVDAVSSYTFSNVTAGHTIAATFALNTYTISASSGTGGSISPSGPTTVNAGANQTFTITPSAGYQIAGVSVDGVSVGAVSTYTFSNVTAGHTITATFAVNSYAISASSGNGGSISPAGATTVNYGGSQAYSITTATGYQIAGVTVDGASVGAVSTYTFSNVTSGHTISATFAIKTYTISASSGTGGSVTPGGATTVNSGGSLSYTITPDTGYQIAGVTVDGVSIGVISSYTFSNVTATHEISVTFTTNLVTYFITASAGPGGSISPPGTTTVISGGSQTFTFTPDPGYVVYGVAIDGRNVGGTMTTYTISNITASHSIYVGFTKQ